MLRDRDPVYGDVFYEATSSTTSGAGRTSVFTRTHLLPGPCIRWMGERWSRSRRSAVFTIGTSARRRDRSSSGEPQGCLSPNVAVGVVGLTWVHGAAEVLGLLLGLRPEKRRLA